MSAADLTPLSDNGLRLLDDAANTLPLDNSLLNTTPARDLSQALNALVEALRALDVGRVQAKSHWWSRLTGADVEARLEFELACRNLAALQEQARQSATAARKTGSLLWKTGQGLKADQQRLAAIIAVCRVAAREPSVKSSDQALLTRFQRRGANLIALHASQAVAIKQVDLAIALLTDLLDRHVEVERLVLPIWRHAGMAVAQSVADPAGAKKTITGLRKTHADILASAEALLEPQDV